MHNNTKDQHVGQGDCLKVYYFPKIPIKHSSSDELEAVEDNRFQRIDFDDNSRPCSDSPDGLVKDVKFAELAKKEEAGGKAVVMEEQAEEEARGNVIALEEQAEEEARGNVIALEEQAEEEARGNVIALEERARKSAVEIEEQAYSQGFTKGEKAGIEAGRKKLEVVLNDFREALLELEKVGKDIYRNTEKQIVKLALAIARKIVCHEIATDEEVVLNVVKEALTNVLDHEEIKIRISPSDSQVLRDAKIQLSTIVDDIENVTIEEDERILDGGCVIETSAGDIDARIEKQFQAVEETLESEFKKSRSRE